MFSNRNLNTQRQQGMVLITALVMLVVLTMLGLSSMGTNTLEERMAANSQEVNRAFQTAEAGLQMALGNADQFDLNRTKANPIVTTINNFANYNADVTFSVAFRQETPPKRGSGWDSNYALYHFDITSAGGTKSGSSTRLHAGSYQVGKKQ